MSVSIVIAVHPGLAEFRDVKCVLEWDKYLEYLKVENKLKFNINELRMETEALW